jgi:hypothetical protein
MREDSSAAQVTHLSLRAPSPSASRLRADDRPAASFPSNRLRTRFKLVTTPATIVADAPGAFADDLENPCCRSSGSIPSDASSPRIPSADELKSLGGPSSDHPPSDDQRPDPRLELRQQQQPDPADHDPYEHVAQDVWGGGR